MDKPEDDLSEEQIRKMERNLLGVKSQRVGPVVEVRKNRLPKKPVPVVEVVAREIPLMEGGDDSFVVTFTAILPDGKRMHLKSVRSPETTDHRVIIREYEAEGRLIRWASKTPEEICNEDDC